MASSKLINRLPVKTVGRDRAYFDTYQYCLRFRMPHLSCVREMDHDAIDEVINYRNTWRERNPNFGGSWHARREPITEEHRINCHAMCDFLQGQRDYKIIISGDWGYLYTNDLAVIQTVEQIPFVQALNITQSVQTRPRDTLRILNSKHEFRTYFRPQRLEQTQRNSLVDFLRSQESIRLSPSLNSFCVDDDKKHYYINENFFLDHDGMGIITMLGLVLPRATRKTVKLIRDK